MTSQLKRIEATLEKLNEKRHNQKFKDLKNPHVYGEVTPHPKVTSDEHKVISFEKPELKKPELKNPENIDTDKAKSSLSLPTFKGHNNEVAPRRYSGNPALPMNLLKDIEGMINQWQNSLIEIQQQIQSIYTEGPLLDGWLESNNLTFEVNTKPRKATDDHLMGYVEELSHRNISYQSPRPGYRLCGKDEMGKVWSQNCPANDIVEVTMAIARYQKLQQLLAQKKKIETRLNQLAEGLVILHSTLQTDL
jgi:hypothetical protein